MLSGLRFGPAGPSEVSDGRCFGIPIFDVGEITASTNSDKPGGDL
jgi:hypothetical protein